MVSCVRFVGFSFLWKMLRLYDFVRNAERREKKRERGDVWGKAERFIHKSVVSEER